MSYIPDVPAKCQYCGKTELVARGQIFYSHKACKREAAKAKKANRKKQ